MSAECPKFGKVALRLLETTRVMHLDWRRRIYVRKKHLISK